jgi:biopolymer transport protein ExbB
VGIIAYFCYNLLTSRVSDVVYKMENSTIEFMDALESGAMSRPAGSLDLEVE